MLRGKKQRGGGRGRGGGPSVGSAGQCDGRTNAILVMLAGLSLLCAAFQFIHVELASRQMFSGDSTSSPWSLPGDSHRPFRDAEGGDTAIAATGKVVSAPVNIEKGGEWGTIWEETGRGDGGPICRFHTLPKALCNTTLIFMAPAPFTTENTTRQDSVLEKAFTKERAARQERAVDSWLQAAPFNVTLVLFVNEISAVEFAESRGIPYLCIDSTLDGLPRFDTLITTMRRQCDDTVVGLINSDIVLRDPGVFGAAIRSLKAFGWTEHPLQFAQPFMKFADVFVDGRLVISEGWFAVAERFDIDADGQETKHMAGGYDFWLWNEVPRKLPVVDVTIPPFWYGRPEFDNWFLDMILSSTTRHAIDLTKVLRLAHHSHSRRLFSGASIRSWGQAKDSLEYILARRALLPIVLQSAIRDKKGG